MPAKLIEKIKKSRQYNTAYLCLRQLSFGFLDMAWYTQTDSIENVIEFEQKAMAPTQLLPIVDGTGMSNQFGHIFSGGYAAGYYGYKWAEVLDADAFSLFKEKGIFNREIAESFRKNILEKGGTEDPMELYKRFRGHEPSIKALMQRDGILNE